MKNNTAILIAIGVFICLFIGCEKNETIAIPDNSYKGLAIFSNTGNNIFTCYINGEPWRTINRISDGFLASGTSEILISKQTDSTQTMLTIEWIGFFYDNMDSSGSLTLYIAVPAGFSGTDINSLQGMRINIDSANGYFVSSGIGYNSERGTGSVYFNKASFNATPTGQYSGSLSGLLEATFYDRKITNGRFDHQLTNMQVQF